MPFLGKTPAQIVDPEVDIDGGSIDGATIGATSASTATVTTFTSTGISDNAASNAMTINSSNDFTFGGNITTTLMHTQTWQTGSTTLTLTPTAGATDSFVFDTSQNAFYSFSIAGTQKARFESGGLVMSGTNITSSQNGFSPATSAWSTGAAFIGTSSYGGGLSLVDGSAGYSVFVDTAGTKFHIAQGSTSGGVDRKVTVDSVGRVGIGEVSPVHLLEVAGSLGVDAPFAGTIANFISDSANSGQGAQIRQYNTYPSGSNGQKFLRVTEVGEWQIINNAYSAACFSVTDAGAASQGNNSSTWTTTSDSRMKSNVRDINDALGKMKALKPCHFEFKKELGKVRTGFVAQEFEQVLAGHVEEKPVPMGYEEFLGEGETTVKAIDANLIPYLVKAIQEQQEIIDSQASAIADLTTRLEALEAN